MRGYKKKQLFLLVFFLMMLHQLVGSEPAAALVSEPVRACVIARETPLTRPLREHIAACLGWQPAPEYALCRGFYTPIVTEPLSADDEVHIAADTVSFYNEAPSKLSGHVEILHENRVVTAETAYIYRDAKSNEIKKVELLGEVKFFEPGRLMIARKATIHPQDNSGIVEDVLYRFNAPSPVPVLPAWGQARLIERFPNKDYLLERATYSTCVPQNNAWHIEARRISLNDSKATGVARDAKLYLGRFPIFYTPYLSFPTSRERKSGFLMPTFGSTNVGGFDFALPYYWNIAPNYDATLIPHLYSLRGLMLGEEFRYLTGMSAGQISGRFLSHDRAYTHFLEEHRLPINHTDRWALQVLNESQLSPNVRFRVNVQQVSDDYFLQDFNSNFAILTERQLLREGQLSYLGEHWALSGLVQSYQTLQPINETPISNIYQRLPQLLSFGVYNDLPWNSTVTIPAQYDNFVWPNRFIRMPDGPRFYLDPTLSIPRIKPWGYITPTVDLVQNFYEVHHFEHNMPHFEHATPHFEHGMPHFEHAMSHAEFHRTIPRFNIDGGLFFERQTALFGEPLTQTLEPRLYYLRVPFHNQAAIPVYDSAYMIFTFDQLFRNNRFSGYDRIGDANQLAYALTTRWISDISGLEKANFSIGQISYFKDRQVGLCHSPFGHCLDNPLALGFLSQTADTSPIASRAVYHFNPYWQALGDYVWDPATHATNNAHLDLRYQTAPNRLFGVGYSYIVSGDITEVRRAGLEVDPLNQASFFYAWPFNDNWSTLGAFNYNLSKKYEMMSFLGVQYDSCCWAVRVLGGRSFMSLSPTARPQYNNNVYLQVQLKGLGSVSSSSPASIIRTFIPGYGDTFHH